ncbi:MAG: hypothetical protein WC004_03220 [Candidatus Absconditabacterales bacterium]
MEKMEHAHADKNCCDDGCVNNGGCPCCSRFRSYCWICKVGSFLFWLLVILALGRFAFGGMGMHRGGYPGAHWNKPGYMMISGDLAPGKGYMENKRGCMGQKRGTVKSWFWGDDANQISGNVTP